jgi:hypothetical protein
MISATDYECSGRRHGRLAVYFALGVEHYAFGTLAGMSEPAPSRGKLHGAMRSKYPRLSPGTDLTSDLGERSLSGATLVVLLLRGSSTSRIHSYSSNQAWTRATCDQVAGIRFDGSRDDYLPDFTAVPAL